MPLDFIQQVDRFCKEKNYVTKKKLKVLAVTFNVNAMIEQDYHMGTIFPDSNKYRADIIIVGFQEIVELSATNVVGSAVLGDIKIHVDTWEKMILDHLNRGITNIRRANDSSHGIMPYVSFKINQMVGTAAIMFVLEAFKPCIKNVQVGNVTRGIGNVLGNKGGVCIRFEIESTSICFVISHLSAHRENVAKRNEDYAAIITSKIFEEKCYGFSTNNNNNNNVSNTSSSISNCDDVNKSSNLLKLNVTLPSATNNKYLDPRLTAVSKDLKALQKRMNVIAPSSSSLSSSSTSTATATATNVVTTAITSTTAAAQSSASLLLPTQTIAEYSDNNTSVIDVTIMSSSNSPFIINPTYSSSTQQPSAIPITNINASAAVSTTSSTVTNILNNNIVSSIITTNTSSTQVSTTGTTNNTTGAATAVGATGINNASATSSTLSSSVSSSAMSVGGTKLQVPISEEITALSQFSPDDHDIIIWLGDLNYRIDELPIHIVYQLIMNSESDAEFRKELFLKDQLYKEMNEGNAFDLFHEAEITFNPTYQYIPGKDAYDRREDKKMRVPAWCDRILYRLGKGAEKMKNILLNLKNEGGNTIVSEILKSAYPSDIRFLKPEIVQQLLSASSICNNDDDLKKGMMRSTLVGFVPSTAAASAALTKQQQQQQQQPMPFSANADNNVSNNNINALTSTSSLSLQRGICSNLINNNESFISNYSNGMSDSTSFNSTTNPTTTTTATTATAIVDVEEYNRRMKLRIKEVREIIRAFYQQVCLEEVKVLSYESCQYNLLSDHKPVRALLEVKVKSVDYAQREAALVECMQTHLCAPDIYGYTSSDNGNSDDYNSSANINLNNLIINSSMPNLPTQQQHQQQSTTTVPLVLATPHYFPPCDFTTAVTSCPTSPARATLTSGSSLSAYGNSYSSANNINNSSFRILGNSISAIGSDTSTNTGTNTTANVTTITGGRAATRPNSSKSIGMSLSSSQTHPVNTVAAALTTSISHAVAVKIPSNLLSLQKSLVLGAVCPLSLQPAAIVISSSNASYIHNIAITNVDFLYTIDFALYESSLPVWLSVTPLTGRLAPSQTLFLNIMYHGFPTVTDDKNDGSLNYNNHNSYGNTSSSNKSSTTTSPSAKDRIMMPSRERERGYDRGGKEKGSSIGTGNLEALLVLYYAQAFSSNGSSNSGNNNGTTNGVEVEPGVVVIDQNSGNTNLLTDFDLEPSTTTTNSSGTNTTNSSSKKNTTTVSNNLPLTLASNVQYNVDKLLIPLSYEAFREY